MSNESHRVSICLRSKFQTAMGFLIRVFLGCVFVASSVPKLQNPVEFLSVVYKYGIAGPVFSKIIAAILPWLEIIIGASLLGGIFVGGATAIATLLFTVFVYAQVFAIYRKLPISCGCFSTGASSDQIAYWTVLRTTAFLSLAVLAMWGWVRDDRRASKHGTV